MPVGHWQPPRIAAVGLHQPEPLHPLLVPVLVDVLEPAYQDLPAVRRVGLALGPWVEARPGMEQQLWPVDAFGILAQHRQSEIARIGSIGPNVLQGGDREVGCGCSCDEQMALEPGRRGDPAVLGQQQPGRLGHRNAP